MTCTATEQSSPPIVPALQATARWLRELRAHRAEGEPHLPLVMMLLGTKADLRRRRAVDAQDAKEFAQRHRLLYAECSSSDASEVCLR